ncbi:11370_t:CDS:2, partial [Entrophospora sp. SA101]
IGNGTEPTIENNLIWLSDEMIVHPQNGKDPIDLLIDTVYPNLIENSMNITFMMERAKLTPLNNDVDEINGFDSIPEDKTNLYPIEYLNSITSQGLPPHELTLKVNVPIMLFRNLDQKTIKQFPVWPAFALTINKSQGQMLPYVDLYLPRPIFSHGQLYVTMSRVHKACNLNALEALRL